MINPSGFDICMLARSRLLPLTHHPIPLQDVAPGVKRELAHTPYGMGREVSARSCNYLQSWIFGKMAWIPSTDGIDLQRMPCA